MRVLVTGADGFVGRNLSLRLQEDEDCEVVPFTRADAPASLPSILADVDTVVHLAGENRPADPSAFEAVNAELTRQLCAAIQASGRTLPLILASSVQAALDNRYGRSKRQAEIAAEELANSGGTATIYRFPGLFGKWCRPNYNSVVATFCHNIARGLPIQVNDPSAVVRLAYIDDVTEDILRTLREPNKGLSWREVEPIYEVTLGDLADKIRAYRASRGTLVTERVGTGLTRALYATYISYLQPSEFAYDVPRYGDERGVFVEMLKTKDSGQFSFFTAHPGVTRGGHYHHTKSEKFLVIKGRARFGFRHMVTGERYELLTSGDAPRIVETVPGWTHDITNVGPDEMVVMLWANEIFDRARPDTFACKV